MGEIHTTLFAFDIQIKVGCVFEEGDLKYRIAREVDDEEVQKTDLDLYVSLTSKYSNRALFWYQCQPLAN